MSPHRRLVALCFLTAITPLIPPGGISLLAVPLRARNREHYRHYQREYQRLYRMRANKTRVRRADKYLNRRWRYDVDGVSHIL
jgi:hypothetical protein